jgi:hypothetical protein
MPFLHYLSPLPRNPRQSFRESGELFSLGGIVVHPEEYGESGESVVARANA